MNSIILQHRAVAQKKMNFNEKAIEVKALLFRAGCYCCKYMFEEAAKDYKAALNLDSNNQSRLLLDEVMADMEKWKKYFDILGVSQDASQKALKRAYNRIQFDQYQS